MFRSLKRLLSHLLHVFTLAAIALASSSVYAASGIHPPSQPPTQASQTVHPNIKRPVKPSTQSMPALDLRSLSSSQHFETDPAKINGKLNSLIQEALEANPTLASAKAAVRASLARVPQAGMPPDPRIGYRLKDMPTTFSWTRENATEQQTIISQSYPFFGKLTLRKEAASRESELTREQLYQTRLQLVTQVRAAFSDIFLTDKDIQITLEDRRMLRELVEIATAKYRVGSGVQQDILNADVALSQLDNRLVELARRRQTREIRLAVLLNHDRVYIEPLGALPPAALAHTRLELEQMAIEMNPAVKAFQKAVERDKTRLKLAKMAVLPDFTIEFDYGVRQDNVIKQAPSKNYRPDMLGFQILFDAPVFYYWKQREQVFEAQANLTRSRSQLEAIRQGTLGGLHDLLARLAQHEQVARHYREQVIPVAQSAVGASISAYQVNKVDFLTMLDAQQKLDRFEADYWFNETARYQDLAHIDEITGGSLLRRGWSSR